jgi:excinuclease UvrABC nuclease subunit
LFILQGLPNVGPARAQTLLDAFGSTAAVMAAGSEGLASVDGIGETVAASIVRALGPEPVVEPKTLVNRFPD